MTLIGSSELSPNRPFFLVYLLPLIVEAAIIVSFVTGFVSVDSGFVPYRPSYGFPFAYKTTYCELLPCAYFLDWSVFWVDVIFYVGLQYILIIFYGAHIGKFPRPSLSQLQDASLDFLRLHHLVRWADDWTGRKFGSRVHGRSSRRSGRSLHLRS